MTTSSNERARQITRLLADLDLLFSFGRNAEGGPLWTLTPFQTPDLPQGISVELWLTEIWLFIIHRKGLKGKPDPQMLERLLRLNTRFSGAKVGLFDPSPEDEQRLCVLSEVSATRLNAENLREGIAAVVGISRELWKIAPD